MNIVPSNQNKLLGFKNEFKEFINMNTDLGINEYWKFD